jgi:ketosteroid isomerase-like protein
MRRLASAVAVLACVALAACTPKPGKKGYVPDVKAEAELLSADRLFSRDTGDRGIDGWVDGFTDDGVMFPTGQPIAKGKAAIRDVMGVLLADPTTRLEWEADQASVSASGDLGYTLGHTTVSRSVPGGRDVIVGRLKYLSVWKRQADGQWKVAATVGSPDPM